MSGYKVKVTGPGGSIVFEASSPMSETRNANYDGFNIIHMPTSLLAYRNTDGRKWSITGKLVSRTADEATANASYVDLARTWLLPDFGGSGATPPILKVYAYRHKNIDGRQVILRNYSWNFPEEVDYIWQAGQAMPIIGQLGLELEEVYSAEQITGKAWKLSQGGGGSFKGGGGSTASSAFWQDFGNARTTPDPIAVANIVSPTFPSISPIMSALNTAFNNPLGVAASLTANAAGVGIGARVGVGLGENAAAVVEVTAQLPTAGNPYVSGVGVTLGATLQPPAPPLPTSSAVVDSFARSNGLPPPTIVGG